MPPDLKKCKQKALTADVLNFIRENFTSHPCIDSGNLNTVEGKLPGFIIISFFYGLHTIVFFELDEHQVSARLQSHEYVDALAFDLTNMLTYADVC